MKSILVAVDFSQGTQRVLDCAADQARAFGCPVWVLHVAAPEPDFVPHAADPPSMRDQVAAELRAEHRQVQALAAQLTERGLDATPLLVAGPTVEKIGEEAASLEAGLVVIGSHGHGLVHRALLGSVSEGLVRHSEVPLLIVPVRDP